MTSEVNLSDISLRNGRQPFGGIVPDVVSAHGDIVYVNQKAASASASKFGEEARFAPAVLTKRKIMRRILDEDLPSDSVLHAADVRRAARQHLIGSGDQQEIGKTAAVKARPGQMLGDKDWLEALDEALECFKMFRIGFIRSSKRHADAVE